MTPNIQSASHSCCAPKLHLLICVRRYGEHLSKEQVAELVAPHPETLEVVGSWLAHHEVPSSSVKITHGGGWITISRVSISQVNILLGASYQLYRHMETNETIVRTIGYSLPAALHKHVETVAPTTYFGSPRALVQLSRIVSGGPTLPNGDLELQTAAASGHRIPVPPTCSETITPTCLRLLYKTDQYKPNATTNKLGIAGYLNQSTSHADFKEFMTLYRQDAVTANFSVKTLNGGFNDENSPTGEVRPVSPARVYAIAILHHTGKPRRPVWWGDVLSDEEHLLHYRWLPALQT